MVVRARGVCCCYPRRTPAASSAPSSRTDADRASSGGGQDAADERRTHDDAVGVPRDLGGLPAGADAQADATGREVWRRVRSTRPWAAEPTESRAPVTPISDAA